VRFKGWPGSPDIVLVCGSCLENEARYIDEHGHLVCGTCPIHYGDDAIKISDVPALLKWCRQVLRGGTMSESGGSSFEALRNILGRKPKLP
jgi:hypothetical protein